MHLLFKLVVNLVKLKSREVATQEGPIHRFEAFSHGLGATGVHMYIEVKLLEDRQIVVPELDGSVEHKPRLFRLLAELHSFDYVVRELAFVFVEGLLLLVGELSVILILVESN